MAYSQKFRVALVAGIITLAVLLFLVSPFFGIREVIVTGNSKISQADILTRLDVGNQSNLLFLNTNAARRRIMENLYIGDVDFEKVLPDRLYVTVQERRLTAYIEHMPGSFLLLDDFGRVLEVRSYEYLDEPLPILEGVQFTRFRLGEVLEVPDAASFGVVVQYAQLLNQHELINRVSHMNVSDPTNIRIIIGYKEFNVGDVMGADEKIRTIVAILNELPNAEKMRGFANIRQNQSEHFFEILQ